MNEEEKLWRALAVSRPEAFWSAQKRRVLARIEGAEKRPRARLVGFSMAAAAAAAALAVALLPRRPAPPPQAAPAMQQWGMLENMDLLENMDAIESLPTPGGGS